MFALVVGYVSLVVVVMTVINEISRSCSDLGKKENKFFVFKKYEKSMYVSVKYQKF